MTWVGFYFEELKRASCGWIYSGPEVRKVFMDMNEWIMKVAATQGRKDQWGDTDPEMAERVICHCQENLRRISGIIQTPRKGALEQARAGSNGRRSRGWYLEMIFFSFAHKNCRSDSAEIRSPEVVIAMETVPEWDRAQRAHARSREVGGYQQMWSSHSADTTPDRIETATTA